MNAKRGNKVVRPSSVKLYGASAFDVCRISHVESRELYPPILFDIQKYSAFDCFVEQDRLTVPT